jgi:hypothetical protein
MDRAHDDRVGTDWRHADAWPTAKQRTGVQHAVRQVLDALVPERTPPRRAEPHGEVQRYRSPRGCILQGEAWAVSVSWFPPASSDETLGELQVISWAGVVSRPGATHRAAGGARPVAEDLLRPVESAGDAWAWRAADGTVLDAGAIAERCLVFLADRADPPAAAAPPRHHPTPLPGRA